MKRMLFFVLMFCVCIGSPLCAVTTNDTAEEQFEALQYRVLNHTYKLRSATYWMGSAWAVKTTNYSGTVLVTAAHCVLDANTHLPTTNIWYVGHPSLDPTKNLSFMLRLYDEKNDVAVLSSSENYKLNELEIENTQLRFGDPLLVAYLYAKPNMDNIIAGNYLARALLSTGVERDLITNHTEKGCSGAPVITFDGYVTSMVRGWFSFKYNLFTVRDAVPHDVIIDALLRAGIHPATHTSIRP